MKLVVLDGYTATQADLTWDAWREFGELVVYERTSNSKLLERAADADALFTNKVTLGAEQFDQLPNLKYIGVLATGYNVVDVAAARERGIVVTNIPAYSTMSVAQMAIAHLLNITNYVARHAQAVDNGEWKHAADFCFQLAPQRELFGQTFAVVGLGNTGLATARIARALGMRVLAFTSKREEELSALSFVKAESMSQVFTEADVLSLHCPLTAETHHLVCEESLALMKPSAILINTGRGGLVDERALASALNEGRLYAAGVDVLEQEPPRDGSPLIGARNCFITPHIAWSTLQSRERLMAIALENFKSFLHGDVQNRVG